MMEIIDMIELGKLKSCIINMFFIEVYQWFGETRHERAQQDYTCSRKTSFVENVRCNLYKDNQMITVSKVFLKFINNFMAWFHIKK